MIDLFSDSEDQKNGVQVFKLDKSDIMRSEIVRYIVEKLEKYQEVIDSFKTKPPSDLT
jgi:hypothetical protein